MTLTVAPAEGEWQGARTVQASGRDLTCAPTGAVTQERVEQFELTLDEQGLIQDSGHGPALPADIIGVVAQRGLRKTLAQLHAQGSQVLGPVGGLTTELLDDLPGFLVASGYGMLFDGSVSDPGEGAGAAMAGVCVGFNRLAAKGETWSVQRFRSRNRSIEFTDANPAVWHRDEPMGAVSVRRRRMLEVLPTPDGVQIEGYFRDVYRGVDGVQYTIHEYGLSAEAVGDPLVLASITPRPGDLPIELCPLAVDNVSQLEGVGLADIEVSVRQALRGPAGCTHLNDEIRSLRMVNALLGYLG